MIWETVGDDGLWFMRRLETVHRTVSTIYLDTMKKERFDYEKFSKEVQDGLREKRPLLGQGGLFTPLLKRFLEAALEGEIQAHMEESRQDSGVKNRRNGKSRKQMQSPLGAFELLSPRDRDGSFELEIVAKRQVKITSDIDQKIIVPGQKLAHPLGPAGAHIQVQTGTEAIDIHHQSD